MGDVAADAAMNARLERIQAACGALCDTSRTAIDRGERFKHSSAPMPCSWLLADGTGIDATLEQRWAPDQLPARWRDEFTMHGRLGLVEEYHNSSVEPQAGGSVGTPRSSKKSRPTNGWARARIDVLVRQARGEVPPPPGKPAGCTNTTLGWSFWTRYRNLNRELWAGLHAANTKDANVLVIGSQSPWVEALALGAGATHVHTLECAAPCRSRLALRWAHHTTPHHTTPHHTTPHHTRALARPRSRSPRAGDPRGLARWVRRAGSVSELPVVCPGTARS